MTDSLSTAAATAGFLSLPGQVADGLVKIARFYNTSRNALEEVSKLKSSMQDLQNAFNILSVQLSQTNGLAGVDARYLQALFQRCDTLKKSLAAKLEALDERMRRYKLGQLEMPFRKEELSNAFTEIERCKTTLLIAQQSFGMDLASKLSSQLTQLYNASVQQQFQSQAVVRIADDTNAEVSLTASEHRPISLSRSDMSVIGHRKETSRTNINLRLVPPGLSTENSVSYGPDTCHTPWTCLATASRRKHRGETTVVEYRLPRWLAKTYNTFCLKRAVSGWTFRLRVYMDLPDYSKFLCACMNGPYVKVEDMLKNNPAVLYERFNGMTGADCALMNYNIDIYNLISNEGARPQMNTDDQISMMLKRPFRYRLGDRETFDGFKGYVEDFEEKMALICAKSEIDDDDVVEYAEREDQMHRRGRREYRTIFRLIRQYPNWAPEEAVQVALLVAPALKFVGSRAGSIYEGLIEEFRASYSAKYLFQTNNFSECAKSMLHVAALRLAETVAFEADTSLWTTLISQSLEAGLDPHLEQHLGYWLPHLIRKPWTTPLGLYCLSLSIALVPWEHHWTVREPLSDYDRFGVFFGATISSPWLRIPPLPLEVITKIDNGLRFWAQFIQSLGMDLNTYGQREIEAFAAAELQIDYDFEQVNTSDSWFCWLSQVHALRTGSEPSEWHFEYLV